MKPILFNTEMARATLEGRKTVTRRVVKTQHKDACGFYVTTRKSDGAFMGVYDYDDAESMYGSPQTPPYKVNDVLYVRETWSEHYTADSDGKLVYCYKADNVNLKAECLSGENNRWYPSIHMPKEAARIFLRVTSVRVERLLAMKKEDFIKEGITTHCDSLECSLCMDECSLEETFKELWNSTLGRKGTPEYYGNSWAGNPFVWVIEFERITKDQAYELNRQQS